MTPLRLLFESPGLPRFPLPAGLASLYGGGLGFERPALYANFVSSVDGVVALREAGDAEIISGESEADHFVMGLLRACADAVLIGAGTFRHAPGGSWRPDAIYPAAADLFADLRGALGLRPSPRLVVVSASGELDTREPALHDALVVTTRAGEARLRKDLPASARIAVLEEGPRWSARLVDLLRAEGLHAVLAEGGPTLLGELVRDGLVDELFLTTSPKLFGRSEHDGRKSLIAGVDVRGTPLVLASARAHGSHLFLRYAIQ